jgi:diguanylate cyclase (GGDEF)-like protein
VLYYVASYLDLSKQKETQAKLEYIKHHDTITGLANKELIIDILQRHLQEGKQVGFGGIISFDIKDFKMINDAYGHSIGDLLLIEISKRLREHFTNSKVIARISSDEFILWFDYLDKTENKASFALKMIARKIDEILSVPFNLKSKKLNIAISIGLVIYDGVKKDAEELIKEADSALHIAKDSDKKIAFFDKKAEEMALAHIDMYNDLLHAIENEEFEMLYQLQFDKEQEVYGAEALIRWQHPQKGLISPLEFIPLAEKTGLILPLGEWIIKDVCRQLKEWQKDKIASKWVIAINISAKQFKQDDFLENLIKEIRKNEIKPQSIKLELTESLLVENIDEIMLKMKEIRDFGMKISLDDFGTGYSSLAYLKNLPIDQIKIDQVFVKNMLFDKRDEAIIRSILLLGKALKIEIIAEGIEKKEDYEFLKQIGCYFYQGYYFARPKNVATIEKEILKKS